eukprot:248413-Amphidinium_carterae.1
MLSGTSTVVAARSYGNVRQVLKVCRERLGLADDGSTMELLHGQERVPHDRTEVSDWPGIQPTGQITEYQILVRR